MRQVTTESFAFPTTATDSQTTNPDPLTELLHRGAKQLLIQAVQAEVDQWLQDRRHLLDERGHRQVVRNGHAASRKIVTGVGAMDIAMPRVHDRRPTESREPFTSKILPPYLRKTKTIDELIPWLYLKGISTGGFSEALQSLLGADCPGLSASTITRLISTWQDEQSAWAKRDLSGEQYVYVWADGIHFNIRLEEDRQCILVLIGATAAGKKELIAVEDGHRESEQSWKSLLLDVRNRGLKIDPKLAIADGALGFWAACRKVWSVTGEQRCWVHKTGNVLNKLPKTLHPQAKDKLQQIWMAPGRKQANTAFDLFIQTYQGKYPHLPQSRCLPGERS